MPRFDLRHFRRLVGRGENVRKQDGLVIADIIRQFDRPYIGKGNTRFLRLQSVEGAALFGAAEEGRTRQWPIRVGIITLRVIASAAIRAVTTGNRCRNNYTISDIQIAHIRPYLLNDTYPLVSKNGPRHHTGKSTANQMEV